MCLEVVLPDLADGLNKEREGKRGARDDVKLNKGKKTPLVKTREQEMENWAQEIRVLLWTY